MAARRTASPLVAGTLMAVVGIPVGIAVTATPLGAAYVAVAAGVGGYLGQRRSKRRRNG